MSLVEPEFDLHGILLERLYEAVAQLGQVLQSMPPAQVSVPPVDLSEVVTAVSGLRPSATAEEIGAAVASRLRPPTNDNGQISEILLNLAAKLEQLDFRMKGSMPAFGASGPSNISDNPDRLLGHVTIDGFTIPGADTAGLASENTLLKVERGVTDYETRLDYGTRLDSLPVYIGKNLEGTATSAATWNVTKLTYDVTNRLTRSQVLTGVWDNRATLPW